jgi:pilus assembly protein Flp/PilA
VAEVLSNTPHDDRADHPKGNNQMTAAFVNVQNRIAARRAEIEERGATAVEYALMVGLIAIGIITSVVFLKDKVATTFNKVGNTMV